MEHAIKTIADLEDKLSKIEAEAAKIKTTINCLCEITTQPIKYPDIREPDLSQLGGDEYHGDPLATAITKVLKRRKGLLLGPCTTDQIYADLIAGGYEFGNKKETIAKRNLAISMAKNPKFYKLPNEKWGLKEWYPVREAKPGEENAKHENLTAEQTKSSEQTTAAKSALPSQPKEERQEQ